MNWIPICQYQCIVWTQETRWFCLYDLAQAMLIAFYTDHSQMWSGICTVIGSALLDTQQVHYWTHFWCHKLKIILSLWNLRVRVRITTCFRYVAVVLKTVWLNSPLCSRSRLHFQRCKTHQNEWIFCFVRWALAKSWVGLKLNHYYYYVWWCCSSVPAWTRTWYLCLDHRPHRPEYL